MCFALIQVTVDHFSGSSNTTLQGQQLETAILAASTVAILKSN